MIGLALSMILGFLAGMGVMATAEDAIIQPVSVYGFLRIVSKWDSLRW